MQRHLFEQVLDAVEGLVADEHGSIHGTAHRRGVKIWFDEATREHYEAQLIRQGGEPALEIGFHSEHPKAEDNDAVLKRLVTKQTAWRKELGETAQAGVFLGADHWRRLSEVWEPPDPDDPEAPVEIAARLADYIDTIEPLRKAPKK